MDSIQFNFQIEKKIKIKISLRYHTPYTVYTNMDHNKWLFVLFLLFLGNIFELD